MHKLSKHCSNISFSKWSSGLSRLHQALETDSSNNSLTPRSRFLLEKLIVTQLVKKLLVFHVTRMLITVCTTSQH